MDFRKDLLDRELQISQSILGKRAAQELDQENGPSKRLKLEVNIANPFAQDADYQFNDLESESEESDEEAELRREYEKIKREREEETRKKE